MKIENFDKIIIYNLFFYKLFLIEIFKFFYKNAKSKEVKRYINLNKYCVPISFVTMGTHCSCCRNICCAACSNRFCPRSITKTIQKCDIETCI